MLSLKTDSRTNRLRRRFRGGGTGRRVRNVSIAVFLLLALIIGGGAAYTWYVGRHSTVVADEVPEPVDKLPDPFEKPKKMAPDAVVGVSVQMITSPLIPGSNAMINIKTNPEAKCKISVTYNNVPSTDSGLSEKVADDFGVVSWTWTVEPTAPLGSWPVHVICANEKKSGEVKTNLSLVKELPESTPAN
jgi:hypothetical protein